jgi:hypothetical protein
MKLLSCALLLMATMAFVLLGCADNPGPVAGSTDQGISSSSATSLAKMGENMHSATGNGHWRVIGPQSRVRFCFSAIQHSDGSFSGEVRNNDEGPTLKFHGKVYDLKVEGNRAKICWKFTSGAYTPPGAPPWDLTGMPSAVVVVDNGGGKNGSGPDQVSLIWCDPPGTFYPAIGKTIEELNALGIDDYLHDVLILAGMSLNDYLPDTDMGSVKVR